MGSERKPSQPSQFKPTAKQQDAQKLLEGSQRHTLLVGGARSGKTTLLVHAIVDPRAARRRLAPRHPAVARQCGAAPRSRSTRCRRCFGSASRPCRCKQHRTEGYFSLKNSSEIWIGGLDDQERVEKILGKEYATIFLNECSQIPYSSVLIALTRLAQVAGDLRRPRITTSTRPARGTGPTFCSATSATRSRGCRSTIRTTTSGCSSIRATTPTNLSADYLKSLERLPERQRKRFFEGAYIDDLDGALFSYEGIAPRARRRARRWPTLPPRRRRGRSVGRRQPRRRERRRDRHRRCRARR